MEAIAILEIEVNAIKMGNYHRISMKIGAQTQKNVLSSKVTKAEVTDRCRHVGT
jgi:hypothetical protein